MVRNGARGLDNGWWLVVSSCALLLSASPAQGIEYKDPTTAMELSGVWLFRPGDNPTFKRRNLDDLHWLERRVPTGVMAWADRWKGFGWYRLHVHVAEVAATTDLMLALGAPREAVELYFNGELIGRRGDFGTLKRGGRGFASLTALVPRSLVRAGDNVIAVRVYDPAYTGGLVSGPFLVGAPRAVQLRLAREVGWVLPLRVFLGLLALFVGLAQFSLGGNRRERRERLWLMLAGVALSIIHLSGTGVFVWLLPAELSCRLPLLFTGLLILCLGSAFAARYEDVVSGRSKVIAVGLAVLAALLLLLPEEALYFGAEPALMVSSLLMVLYLAHLCAQAVRRNEEGAIPMFLGLGALAVLIVYDGWTVASSDLLPPKAVMGGVPLLALFAWVSARQTIRDHDAALVRARRLSDRLEGEQVFSLLEGSTLSLLDPERFLSALVQEVARVMEVRRCSLVLSHTDGSLWIRASVGLPKKVARSQIQPGSITARAFDAGALLNGGSLSTDLEHQRQRKAHYATDAFVVAPMSHQGRVLGVLNLSDRNDGSHFSAEDEQRIEGVCTTLAIAMSRLPDTALEPPAYDQEGTAEVGVTSGSQSGVTPEDNHSGESTPEDFAQDDGAPASPRAPSDGEAELEPEAGPETDSGDDGAPSPEIEVVSRIDVGNLSEPTTLYPPSSPGVARSDRSDVDVAMDNPEVATVDEEEGQNSPRSE